MELTEEIRCHKCFSPNPSSLGHCRYCHERFGRSVNPVGLAAIDTINRIDGEINTDAPLSRNLMIAGSAGILILAAGYLIFG